MRSDSKVYKLIQKSRDAALLAVEIYNKPRTEFRTAGFIVMMHVAWTALFHAIYERDGVKYFYKKKDKHRYERIDGDYKTWELAECINRYDGVLTPPVKSNLDFFIKLRNKIEHRFAPALDHDVFGECQANLMNYENLLEKEFGRKFSINQNLVFSLQFANILHPQQNKIFKKRQSKDYKELKDFVNVYRSNLNELVLNSLNYNFKVYLLPKVGNHRSSSDFTIEFIPYDIDDPEEMKKYKKFLVAIREKRGPVDGLTPKQVADRVFEALKDKMPPDWKFNASTHHAKCWKYYKVRPLSKSPHPEKTQTQYCIYHKPFKQYTYTEDWVKFLIKKLSNLREYNKIMKGR